MGSATKKALDFSNVKEGSAFRTKRQPEGEYRGVIKDVTDAPTKGDGTAQWCFVIQVGAGVYPYYTKLVENQLWKVRNIFVAAGKAVPKKRLQVDPNVLVGKAIGVVLEDDEYEKDDKTIKRSAIAAVLPLSEITPLNDSTGRDDDDDDDDDDEEEEVPKPKKKAKPVDDDDDDDDEDEEPAPKKAKKKAKPEPEDDDDDDDDEDEEPAPKKAKKKAKDDDDDDDIDIEDL